MTHAFARFLRSVLAFGTGLAALLLSPVVATASAEDNGLGAGGAAFAFNYTLIVGIALAFVFGFGLRDYIQKRILRANARKAAQTPKRA